MALGRSIGSVWLVMAAAALAAGAQETTGSFRDCAADFAADPAGEQASHCVYATWRKAQVAAESGGSEGSGAAERATAEAVAILAEAAERDPASGWPSFFTGFIRWSVPEEAQAEFAEAARRFAAAGDARGEVLARGNRQPLLYDLGRLDEAEREVVEAVRVARSAGELDLVTQAKIFHARHLQTTGRDLEEVFLLLREIVDALPAGSTDARTLTSLASLGSVAIEISRWSVAEETYDRLLATAERIDHSFYRAEASYGATRLAAERFAEAPTERGRHETLELARRTVAVSDDGVHRTAEVLSHWMLGTMSPARERRHHLERCAELAAAAKNPRNEAYCLGALARHLAETDPVAARRVVARAFELSEEAEDPFSSAFAWRERMRVAWAADRPDEAVAVSWEALAAIETLRDLQEGGSDVQAGLFSTWSDDYQWFAGRLLREVQESGRVDLLPEAFAASERLRARALTDWLRRAAGPRQVVQGAGEFAALEEIRRALGPNQALLAYQVAPWQDVAGDFAGGAWLIVVTREGVRVHALAEGRREIRFAVDLYTGLFDARDGSEARPSVELYRRLLEPALSELPPAVDRLVIVPDDALHRLPFAALRKRADGAPLIADHEIEIAPSATLWLRWRRGGPPPASAQALRAGIVMADPEIPAAAHRLVRGRKLPRLRHALLEGRAAAAALGPTADLRSGAEATEGYLRGLDLEPFGLVHFAVHAVTDGENPERSAVVLAVGPEGEDGLLQASEIVSLDLEGKLVVLSSCRTADGTVLRGEGVMSLARAFFQAGARVVVASLWPLRDDDAETLFEGFYGHLARGESVGAAMRAAQERLRRRGAPAQAWAGLVVLGDGDLRPRLPPPPTRSVAAWAAWTVVVSLVVAVLAWLGYLARRRRLLRRRGNPSARAVYSRHPE